MRACVCVYMRACMYVCVCVHNSVCGAVELLQSTLKEMFTVFFHWTIQPFSQHLYPTHLHLAPTIFLYGIKNRIAQTEVYS